MVLAAGLPVDRKRYPPGGKTSQLPTISYVVAAYRLGKFFPQWLICYTDPVRVSEESKTLGNIHPENWHRLFQAIRFFLYMLGNNISQHKEDSRKIVKKPQNKSAIRLHYLTKEDCAGVSQKKAAKASAQADSAFAITQVHELLHSSLLSQKEQAGKRKNRDEVEEAITEFGEALTITGKRPKAGGTTMPPLTAEAQGRLLDLIFQRLSKDRRILWPPKDPFDIPAAKFTVVGEQMVSDTVAADLSGAAPVGVSHDSEAMKEFWRFTKKMNSNTVELPSYPDACRILGVDVRRPARKRLKHGKEFEILLQEHQVVGAAGMVRHILSDLRGVIMGDEVGLGKSHESTCAVGRVLELRQLTATDEGLDELNKLEDLLPVEDIPNARPLTGYSCVICPKSATQI
ncbi:hypothetical protein K491DRAFT_742512 [Lophiostoma macrostomum CBS 122681]|uniref:Uncharacterized protein n=1 Tax=Lophiostoma macrostomum CBS 122681 TaxID=1314788 RepID=A0A6A6SH86_9PLEO|nr:hypothetical protein K491DRAFT_742512 [Lophiostoma macrostomum CBS 122681]